MTIEVKQLLVKSTVQDSARAGASAAKPAIDQGVLKEELLAECKRMLVELLRERKDR